MHSEHHFPAPSFLKEGCRKPMLGVRGGGWRVESEGKSKKYVVTDYCITCD